MLQFSINGNAIILKTKKVSNQKNKEKTIDTTNWIKPYSDENMKNGKINHGTNQGVNTVKT